MSSKGARSAIFRVSLSWRKVVNSKQNDSRDDVWSQAHLSHLLEQQKRSHPLVAALARSHGGVVGDHVGRDAAHAHLLQQRERGRPLLALGARADGGVEAHHVGLEAKVDHFLQKAQRALEWRFG